MHRLRACPARLRAMVNGARAGEWKIDRTGLFVLEADLPQAKEYLLEILSSPTYQAPPDDRTFSANFSMIRLVDA